MVGMDLLETLVARVERELGSLIGKAEGVSEYDARRPLVPSGTNLLGLVQHTSAVTLGYVTEIFGRDPGWDMPYFADGAAEGADMWVAADVPREHVIALGRHTLEQVRLTGTELRIDSRGRVPWWPPERADVTLGVMLVHVLAEVSRHAGHADILREQVDGALGQRPDDPNLPGYDATGWSVFTATIQEAADQHR